jgi:hypothetical protein
VEEPPLYQTPTWAVAAIRGVIVAVSILLEASSTTSGRLVRIIPFPINPSAIEKQDRTDASSAVSNCLMEWRDAFCVTSKHTGRQCEALLLLL